MITIVFSGPSESFPDLDGGDFGFAYVSSPEKIAPCARSLFRSGADKALVRFQGVTYLMKPVDAEGNYKRSRVDNHRLAAFC